MTFKYNLLIISSLISSLVLSLPANHENKVHNHSHSRLAVENCDDTKNGIGIDWDGEDDYINEKYYKCFNNTLSISEIFIEELCKTPPMGYHVCLKDQIIYPEPVPIGGPHRPVWVTYGEYKYMPPQRWVHAIEHGAAVFLFNPCANPEEIEYFKSLAKNCLRKHVITPYNNLPDKELFNIVTFGCRLRLNKILGQEDKIIDYLQRHAIKDGPEFHIPEDGDYNFGMVEKAKIVSDINDSEICKNIL